MSGTGGLSMMRRVFVAVAAETGVQPHLLAGGRHRRSREVSLARALFVGICREMTDRSYPGLAAFLRLTSHSSCVEQNQRYTRLLASGNVFTFNGVSKTMVEVRAAVYERLGAKESER